MSHIYYGPTFDNSMILSEAWYNYVLDVLGFVPLVGNAADLLNSLTHATAGEFLFAAFSALAALPAPLGWVFAPFKWIVKIAQVVSGVANFGADREGHEDRVARSLGRMEDTITPKDEEKVADASIKMKDKILDNKPKIDAELDKIEKKSAGSKLGKHMPEIRRALDDFVTGRTKLAPKSQPASRQLTAGYTRMSESHLRAVIRKAVIVYS